MGGGGGGQPNFGSFGGPGFAAPMMGMGGMPGMGMGGLPGMGMVGGFGGLGNLGMDSSFLNPVLQQRIEFLEKQIARFNGKNPAIASQPPPDEGGAPPA